MFYLEGLMQSLNISGQECIEANMNKLLTGEKARYKLGVYSDKQAQDRADKKEAEALVKLLDISSQEYKNGNYCSGEELKLRLQNEFEKEGE
jgi:hypothetical protein